MPAATRKRTTKGRPKKDESLSSVSSEHQDKKQMILKDFDKQVKQRVKAMQTDLKMALNRVENMYAVQLISIPAEIKNMNLEEFWASGSNPTAIFDKIEQKMEKDVDENIAHVLQKKLPPRSCRRAVKQSQMGSTFKSALLRTTSRQLRSTVKKGMNDTEASFLDTTFNAIDTTMYSLNIKGLPDKTPANRCRNALPNEFCYSVRGSPIIVRAVGEPTLLRSEKSSCLNDVPTTTNKLRNK